MSDKKITLSPEVQALSEKIQAQITFDRETGSGNTGDKDLYKECLPESLTMDVVKSVNNYTRDFVAAGIHAAGIKSIEAMAGNKKLEKTSITYGLEGRDKVEAVFNRSETLNNPLTKQTTTHYCNPHVKVSMRAGDKGSAMTNAFKLVREAAAEKLA